MVFSMERVCEKRHISLFLFLGLLFVASFNVNARIVEAKGVSEIDGEKVVEARKIALENAKRAAVEQVVGTFIRARTDVNNFMLGKDQIYSSTAGKIDEYKILDDGVSELGIYEVVIKADVRVNELLSTAAEIQASMGWTKKPRITVVANEKSSDYLIVKQVKTQMIKRLLRDGFDVFEEDEPVYSGFVLDILANSDTRSEDFQGMSITSNEITLNFTISRVGDNQVLASSIRSENKAGVNSNKIFAKLSDKIIKRSWPDLRKQVLHFWKTEQLEARNIYLDIEGVDSLEQANQMASVFKDAMPAIQQIEISDISGGVAHLVITYKGWTEQLYEEIVASQIAQRHTMRIIGVKGNKITATIA